jgi:hypothetical protein
MLGSTEGFIDNERFESQSLQGWVLSQSTWRDDKSLVHNFTPPSACQFARSSSDTQVERISRRMGYQPERILSARIGRIDISFPYARRLDYDQMDLR